MVCVVGILLASYVWQLLEIGDVLYETKLQFWLYLLLPGSKIGYIIRDVFNDYNFKFNL